MSRSVKIMSFSCKLLVSFALAAQLVSASPNGHCTISGGVAGVCLRTADCSSGGGKSTAGFCPDDIPDVKCCTKSACGSSDQSGDCRWTSQCSGTTLSGFCPGPTDFKCCLSSSSGGGNSGDPGSGSSTSTSHDLSANGVAFIAKFEGFEPSFYNDAAGVKTIGYGHACQPSSSCNDIKAPITEGEGKNLLKSDAASFVSCVNTNVKVPLNQNQFDALVSFTYNLGCGSLQEIAGKLNSKDFAGATASMKQYVHAGGKVLQGLVTRRNEEVDLFNS